MLSGEKHSTVRLLVLGWWGIQQSGQMGLHVYVVLCVSINPVHSPFLLLAATTRQAPSEMSEFVPHLLYLWYSWNLIMWLKVGKHGISVRICTNIWRQKCRRHKNKCPNIPGPTDTISCICSLSIFLIFLKTRFGTWLYSSPGKLARNLVNSLNHATLSLATKETLNLSRYVPQKRGSPREVKTAI